MAGRWVRTRWSPPSPTCATRSTACASTAGARGAADLLRGRRRRSPSSCSGAPAVEVAVVEVGLGGRLDATNVVSPPHSLPRRSPRSRSITSAYLGTTLSDIALEKAGIIKPGVPVVRRTAASRRPRPSSSGSRDERGAAIRCGRRPRMPAASRSASQALISARTRPSPSGS